MGMIARVGEKITLEDWPSAKIGHHENFPLYGIMYTLTVTQG
jgi:hypothetical protein